MLILIGIKLLEQFDCRHISQYVDSLIIKIDGEGLDYNQLTDEGWFFPIIIFLRVFL